MAVRKIVRIDEEKCDGCGECIVNCPEGALQIVDGKARVVRESYCDGLGVCIGTCPVGAITIEEREAEAFNEEAVTKYMAERSPERTSSSATVKSNQEAVTKYMAERSPERTSSSATVKLREEAVTNSMATAQQHQAEAETPMPILSNPSRSCPGSAVRQLDRTPDSGPESPDSPSQLCHWPVQLALVPPGAPFLKQANLLLAADCVPFALAEFHARFLRGRSVVVGCPKLDDPQSYVRKLTDILAQAAIRSLTTIVMEVPCCTGLCQIARVAMDRSGRNVPLREVTVSVDGRVIANQQWYGASAEADEER